MTEIRQINTFIKLGLLDLKRFSVEGGPVAKRELEKSGTRYLIEKLLNTSEFQLRYTPQKKPYLEGRTEHISISHSHDWLAIIMNTRENTGIDIELVRDKVKNVQHKFLNEQEKRFALNDTEKLITIWAAKEALYKVYGLKELEFIQHLSVEEFKNGRLFGNILQGDFKKRFELATELVNGNYRLVYVLNEV